MPVNRERARLALLRWAGLALRGIPRPVPDGRQRILVIRPDHLGDVLLTRPAIERLARAVPDADLTVAIGPWGRPALGPRPAHTILICPFPGFSREHSSPFHRYWLLVHYARLLRRRRYTLVVIGRPDHWWGALLAALAGIPTRIGYGTPETAPFLTLALPPEPGRHAAADALALARAAVRYLGKECPADDHPPLPASAGPEERAVMARLLAAAGIGEEPLVVLQPGAGSPLKAWPPERLAAAGAVLARELGARVVVSGSASEHGLVQQVCDMLPEGGLNLAGALRWTELEALLARATLVVGLDSGPLHLAVAAGTPSVALFGPADPAQFGPWGSPARHRVVTAALPCRPCRRLDWCALEPEGTGPPPCMRAISVEELVEAARLAVREGHDGIEATR
ncbi:MAG TPA: glycosyltransferase family 9 protein [Chloroflexota bacterium]|nr:glycosyltransferase family 9 protein [Chloroflexota bacterium]